MKSLLSMTGGSSSLEQDMKITKVSIVIINRSDFNINLADWVIFAFMIEKFLAVEY
ncbi:MAG: hypothetical protein RJQ05_00915 [Cytophagales bacterium]